MKTAKFIRLSMSLLVAMVMLMGITACGGNNIAEIPTDMPQEVVESTPTTAVVEEPEPIEPEEEIVEEEPFSLTFTDSLGTSFTFDEPIDEVIVLNRQTAEAIKILGAEEYVVATGDTTVANMPYLGYDELPDVGETGEPNLELIISLAPDVVLAHTNRSMELEEKLNPVGIEVVRIDNYQPERFDEEMLLLGQILGKQEKAQTFLDYRHEVEDLVASRLEGLEDADKPTVTALSVGFLNSQGGYRIFPAYSIDGSLGVGEGYSTILAGGQDATPEIQYDQVEAGTTILVDEELVLSANPQVLTLHGTWLGGYQENDPNTFKDVMENCRAISSVDQTTAGETDQIFIFHTDMLGASKRHIGVLQLAKYLHPELFDDIDPQEYAAEYFNDWLGADFEGIWWYAAESQAAN